MISVEKMFEDIRKEGVNYGLPTVFLRLGDGNMYPSVEGLVREIVFKSKCQWVCILGSNTTQVGMGSVIRGLASVGMRIEVECNGTTKEPGWLHSVDRWIVDYSESSVFNLSSLRSSDMVRYSVEGEGDFNLMQQGFKALKSVFPGTSYVNLKNKKMLPEVFAFARQYSNARIYLMNGEVK